MNRTSVGIVGLLGALGFTGCATGTSGGKAPVRGAVVTRAPGAVALVRGPGVLHVYAGFSGGAIYAARSKTGTDADCAVSEETRQGLKIIEGDQVETLSLPAGMVGCLVTHTRRSYELLWHVRPAPAGEQPDVLMAAER